MGRPSPALQALQAVPPTHLVVGAHPSPLASLVLAACPLWQGLEVALAMQAREPRPMVSLASQALAGPQALRDLVEPQASQAPAEPPASLAAFRSVKALAEPLAAQGLEEPPAAQTLAES